MPFFNPGQNTVYGKQIEPQDAEGHFGGLIGGHKSKSLGRLSIGTKFGTRLRIRLGMDIG